MLKDLIIKNRSFRSFKPGVKMSAEMLTDFIDTIRFAPSSVNLQPLKFMVCTEAEDCELLRQNVKYAKALKGITLPPEGHYPSAYILIFLDTDISDNLLTFRRDVGIVAQSLMLLAVEAGYGGCMIGNFNGPAIMEALRTPKNCSLQLVLALGEPDEEIILEEAKDGKITYYRDEAFVHHVPKRPLDEIIIKR